MDMDCPRLGLTCVAPLGQHTSQLLYKAHQWQACSGQCACRRRCPAPRQAQPHLDTGERGGVKRASWNLTPLLSLTQDVLYL